jgi:hypothetical protein
VPHTQHLRGGEAHRRSLGFARDDKSDLCFKPRDLLADEGWAVCPRDLPHRFIIDSRLCPNHEPMRAHTRHLRGGEAHRRSLGFARDDKSDLCFKPRDLLADEGWAVCPRGLPHLAKNERDTRISCTRHQATVTCAAFIEESRMKFINAKQTSQEIRGVGHPSVHPHGEIPEEIGQFLPSSHVVAFSMRVFCTGLVKILSPWPIFI